MSRNYYFRGRSISLGPEARVMGILNVTPDSFSDGETHFEPGRLAESARQMIENGASILDIGGESSRPGAVSVNVAEELRRVIPSIQRIRSFSQIPISIDTVKPEVASEAIAAGADIINDITGMTNPNMRQVAVREGAGVVIMHMKGVPQNMQEAPEYLDVLHEVSGFLRSQANQLIEEGLPLQNILIDPGIGFGKTQNHNISLIRGLPQLAKLGFPLLLGVSRKSLIGKLTGRPTPERMPGSLGVHAFALSLPGSQNSGLILRVHDVGPTWDLVRVWHGLSV